MNKVNDTNTIESKHPMRYIILGGLIGLSAAAYMFWPNIFGERLTVEEVTSIINEGGDDFDFFVLPWMYKSVVGALIGGVTGYLLFKVK